MRLHTVIPSPLGDLVLVFEEPSLIGLYQPKQVTKVDKGVKVENNYSARVEEAVEQVKEYLSGKRKQITTSVEFVGTDLQKKVWAGIAQIPFGETITYSELTKRL